MIWSRTCELARRGYINQATHNGRRRKTGDPVRTGPVAVRWRWRLPRFRQSGYRCARRRRCALTLGWEQMSSRGVSKERRERGRRARRRQRQKMAVINRHARDGRQLSPFRAMTLPFSFPPSGDRGKQGRYPVGVLDSRACVTSQAVAHHARPVHLTASHLLPRCLIFLPCGPDKKEDMPFVFWTHGAVLCRLTSSQPSCPPNQLANCQLSAHLTAPHVSPRRLPVAVPLFPLLHYAVGNTHEYEPSLLLSSLLPLFDSPPRPIKTPPHSLL